MLEVTLFVVKKLNLKLKDGGGMMIPALDHGRSQGRDRGCPILDYRVYMLIPDSHILPGKYSVPEILGVFPGKFQNSQNSRIPGTPCPSPIMDHVCDRSIHAFFMNGEYFPRINNYSIFFNEIIMDIFRTSYLSHPEDQHFLQINEISFRIKSQRLRIIS